MELKNETGYGTRRAAVVRTEGRHGTTGRFLTVTAFLKTGSPDTVAASDSRRAVEQ